MNDSSVPSRRAEWAAVRQQGRRRYIALHGVLAYGLPTAIGSTLLGEWLGAPGPFVGRLAIALVMFSLSAIWFGARLWSHNERRYGADANSPSTRVEGGRQ